MLCSFGSCWLVVGWVAPNECAAITCRHAPHTITFTQAIPRPEYHMALVSCVLRHQQPNFGTTHDVRCRTVDASHTLVKPWSKPGQIQVKPWSNRGQAQVMRDLGGPQAVHNHTSAIAEYAYWGLRQLRHPNGAPLVRVDGKWGLHSAPALR